MWSIFDVSAANAASLQKASLRYLTPSHIRPLLSYMFPALPYMTSRFNFVWHPYAITFSQFSDSMSNVLML